MTIPKQIIYPLRYLSPFACSNSDAHEQQFLKSFSQLVSLPHDCLPIGRARTGVYLLVKALVATGRNKVVMSPYTIPDLVNMVLFAGGIPVFVDTEPKSTDVCVDGLQKLINKDVCAVLVTHYHVNQARFTDILDVCDSHGVQVIEDCAISLGGTIDGNGVGTQSCGGVFSLSSHKFLNYLWGGAVICKDLAFQESIASEVKSWKRLRPRDYRSQLLRTLKYDFATRPLTFNWITAPMLRHKQSRSTDVQMLKQPRIESESFDASLQSRPSAGAFREWNSKIAEVEKNLKHRRQIASIYTKHLAEVSIGTCIDTVLKESCFVNYPIWVGAERRDKIYRRMILNGYDVGLSLYPNVHEYEKFKHCEGQSKEIATLTRSVLSLPCHPRVCEQYAEDLARALTTELK